MSNKNKVQYVFPRDPPAIVLNITDPCKRCIKCNKGGDFKTESFASGAKKGKNRKGSPNERKI